MAIGEKNIIKIRQEKRTEENWKYGVERMGGRNYRKREEEETYFSTLTEIIEENWKIESASQEKWR